MTRVDPAATWTVAAPAAAAADLESCGYSAGLSALLARRGLTDRQAAAAFLSPHLDQLHDPFRLTGMHAAVERLVAARDRNELVAIVGDYDVDGVSATALLVAVMAACGITARPILPHRLREGYGFQPLHVERARELDCRLIVTADCGSSAGDAVAAALAAGIDVIVTDHHLPGADLPAGATQINPWQHGCTYPFRDLAAAGLAFKLATALAARCGKTVDPAALLRIACLGTIADLVPLLGENRVIAALGLRALGDCRSHGLRALIQQSGLRPPYTAADVGFRLGPRLNAAGRLHDADRALELLLSRDPARAQALAAELDGLNRERQNAELRVVDEARQQVADRHAAGAGFSEGGQNSIVAEGPPGATSSAGSEDRAGAYTAAGVATGGGALPAIVVAWSADWHKGVVGIAAGRLAKELNRPTVLLTMEGDVATGSGRSVPGVALHSFLAQWQPRMKRFGGHAQAVGLSVDCGSLEALRDEWERAAGEAWAPACRERHQVYDFAVAPRAVTPDLVHDLRQLEPFGQGNPQPLLRTGPLRLRRPPRPFGKGHLSAECESDDGARIELVGWSWARRADDLQGRFEVLAHAEIDTWHGGAVLRLVDCRPV